MIAIKNLHYAWGKHALFNQLNTHTSENGVIGLFGRNGSGKSSLLKILAGLLAPHSGCVRVNGFEPRQRQAEFLASLCLLPEEFHLPDLTTRALAQTQAPFYPRFDHAQFERYLAAFEVPNDQRFSRMSLGQKKKAAIALALATHTPVLLMDEPTNGLDIVSRATFKQLLSEPVQRDRLILISTHQAHDLESVMDQIWFIDDGRLVLSASTHDIAKALEMGASALATDAPSDRLVYQEALGTHTAWIARRTPEKDDATAKQTIPLEMLYKALSHNKSGVLAAMAVSANEAV